jgi:hypothetical protein
MFPPCRHEKRFFDYPHGDNLYSNAGFVKHHLHRQERGRRGKARGKNPAKIKGENEVEA